jgi:hypothetical protein
LRKASLATGDGFSLRHLRGFGTNLDISPCSSAFTSPQFIEEIANDSAVQPPEPRIVQEIVQCFAGLFWAPLPTSIAAASRNGESLILLGISARRMLEALAEW